MDNDDLLNLVKSRQQKLGVQPIIEFKHKPKPAIEEKHVDYSRCCLCKEVNNLIKFYNVPICKKCKNKLEHDVEVKYGI